MEFGESTKSYSSKNAINSVLRFYFLNFDKTLREEYSLGEITFNDFLENKMLIIQAIKHGVSYQLYSAINQTTPFTDDDWAEYLNLSKKTLQRNSQEENFFFKSIHSEKIIELAEVTHFGNHVFDTKKQFQLWLCTPSYALGNILPSVLLKDSYGKELVMDELNRIDQGIFA